MPIIGHGVDVVEVERISEMVREHGQRFIDRCFTPAEADYAAAGGPRRMEHLAGRFAVKEAVLKALGTGWRNGIAWTDLEIVLEASGRPILRVTGVAREIAEARMIAQWFVSLSHTRRYAIGSAIAVDDPVDRVVA